MTGDLLVTLVLETKHFGLKTLKRKLECFQAIQYATTWILMSPSKKIEYGATQIIGWHSSPSPDKAQFMKGKKRSQDKWENVNDILSFWTLPGDRGQKITKFRVLLNHGKVRGTSVNYVLNTTLSRLFTRVFSLTVTGFTRAFLFSRCGKGHVKKWCTYG